MESYEDIDLKKVEKEKELQKAQSDLSTVEIEELGVKREVILLRLKQNKLQEIITKAKQNVRFLILEVRILTSQFYRAKG